MHIYIFSFTRNAAILSLKLQRLFNEEGYNCTSYTPSRFADNKELFPVDKPLKEIIAGCFLKNNVIIFISACGIAVRSIAPYIESKAADPCVLVIDEKGQFVISLLSGHIGKGNLFTLKTASMINATPVVSTATDLNNKFAPDIFAQKNNLVISDMEMAKKISANILDGGNIYMSGNIPDSAFPGCIVPVNPVKDNSYSINKSPGINNVHNIDMGIHISPFYKPAPYKNTLFLIPKQVVIGTGCKKNTDPGALINFVSGILSENNISPASVAVITSIDIKKDEEAIKRLAGKFNVDFVTYSAETLCAVQGNFTTSAFVQEVTGADNVCERSCIAYSKAEKLLLPKTAYNGMTVAIALIPFKTHF